MAAIAWKTLSQVSMLSPGSASGTLLQLSGKLLSDALKVQTFDSFIRTALSEIASELSVQWIGLAQRIPGPGWDVIVEHGQQAMSVRPISLWDEALDRDAAGVSRTEQGKILAAFPLTANSPFAHLLVTAGRHADRRERRRRSAAGRRAARVSAGHLVIAIRAADAHLCPDAQTTEAP